MRVYRTYLRKMSVMTGFLFLLSAHTAQGINEAHNCASCHVTVESGPMAPGHPWVGEPGSALFLRIEELLLAVDNGGFLSSLHSDKQITCGACHQDSYEIGSEIQTSTCLGCHGSYEEVAETTRNREVEEANPHRSHLGEIDCTVCHHAHERSVTYCIQCHAEIIETIPGN